MAPSLFARAIPITSEARSYLPVILHGTLHQSSPLSALRGNALVLSHIFKILDAHWYPTYLTRDSDTDGLPFMTSPHPSSPSSRVSSPVNDVAFPPPSTHGIDVNMMPINLRCLDASLPEFLAQYKDLIRSCPVPCYDSVGERDRIAYLTVQEGYVPVGKPQRRPGVHVERPRPNGE